MIGITPHPMNPQGRSP